MPATATIRDLRNRFPEIKKIVESEGEVILTERGKPKYRLTPLRQSKARKRRVAKDYMERLRRYQPRPLSASEARSLRNENRGDR